MGSREIVRRSGGLGAATEIARIEKRRHQTRSGEWWDPHRIQVLILCNVELGRRIPGSSNGGDIPEENVTALPVPSGPGPPASPQETYGEVLLDYRLRINGEVGRGGRTPSRPVMRT
ncbi:hypothetical protein GCM10027073_12520 [Streptomyces chlorus]